MAKNTSLTVLHRFLVVALLAAYAGGVAAEPGAPLGPQYAVAGQPDAGQVLPAVGLTPAGQSLVVYIETQPTGMNLLAQSRYARTAPALPQDYAIARTPNAMFWPALGLSKYGYALVAWQENSPTGEPLALWAQPYFSADATTPSGPAFRLDGGAQTYYPAVAADWYGTRYAVAWVQKENDGTYYGVHLQHYDSAALPVGAPQRVDVAGMNIFQPVSLAMSDGARHAVAWFGHLAPGDLHTGIFVQRYDDMTPVGAPQLVVAAPRGGYVTRPGLAMAGDGSYVVAWEQGYAIQLQCYTADGAPLGAVQQVSSVGAGVAKRSNPSIALDRDRNFVVVWDAQDGANYHVMARRYAADGTPRGGEYAVEEFADGQQVLPKVKIDADGDALVAWTSTGASGDQYRVYARRLQGDAAVDLAVDAADPGQDYDLADTVPVSIAASNLASVPDCLHEGAGTATGVTLDLAPQPGTQLVAAGGDGWQCAAAAPAWQCRYARTLPPAQTAPPLVAQLRAVSGAAALAVEATLRGEQADPVPGNDTVRVGVTLHDHVPDAFAFAPRSDVALGSVQVSDAVIVGGIDAPVTLTVSGGEASVNGGAYSSAAATVRNGDSVRLRHTAAATFATAVTTTATIGGVSGSFTSTTMARDATPDAYTFADQSGVATASTVASAPIVVSGINVAVPVSVSGGSYSVNGGAFTTIAGTVNAGDQVRVQHVSAPAAATAVNTTLSVGGVQDTFTSTTGSADTTPNAYAFVDVTGAKRGRSATSAGVTVSGFNRAVPIAVSGADARWSKNGGAWTSAAGTVVNGDRVALQVTAASAANATVNVDVVIGGVSDRWSVTSGTR